MTSCRISAGASKPKGCGLPMLSLRMRCPSASRAAARALTGPRMSYRTSLNFSDWRKTAVMESFFHPGILTTRIASVEGADDLEGVGEVVGVVGLELDVVARTRVNEAEPLGVQPLAVEADPLGERRIRAVHQVADARMMQRAHVHADLMGAPGLEVDREQACEAVSLERVVVRDALAPAVLDRELEVVLRMPRDRRVDSAGVRVRVALHERVVRLVD